jgi:transcriptional regulator with XRE-family HTH domain
MAVSMEKTLLNREIGKRVRCLRDSRGITRIALAEQLGITPSYMGLIERGERGLNLSKCIVLSEVFCVSTDYILTGRGELVRKKEVDSLAEGNQFSPHERQLLSEFITAYSLISPSKRNADIIFENIRFSLSQYIKIINCATQNIAN